MNTQQLKRYKPKPFIAVTFDDFVVYAKNNSPQPHWSFEFNGCNVTHENDDCYLLLDAFGNTLRFERGHVLIPKGNKTFEIMKEDYFKRWQRYNSVGKELTTTSG